MGYRKFMYHPDCIEGKIFDSDETEQLKEEGWFESHHDAKKVLAERSPGKTEDDTGEPKEYKDMKVKELQALSKERDIPIPAGTNKDGIIKLLVADDGGSTADT